MATEHKDFRVKGREILLYRTTHYGWNQSVHGYSHCNILAGYLDNYSQVTSKYHTEYSHLGLIIVL